MASSSSILIPLYDDLPGWFDVNSVCLFWPPGQRRATLIRKPLTSETGGKSYFHNVGIIQSYFLIILILVSPPPQSAYLVVGYISNVVILECFLCFVFTP